MHKLFKPLSKRDAKIAAVLFGAGFLYMLYSIIRDMTAGRTFDELHSDFIVLAFIGIIEWGMITVGFTKDKKQNEKEEASPQISSGEEQEDIAEEYTEGLSEEYEGSEGSGEEYGGDGCSDSGDSSGGESGEAG